ncbi:Ankyrin repeat protein 1 [Giardia muris]|uniref:Ankyrin repeat protein 1 n=1 Tax=Giardia muris TaxID=5742 RepID=A0A4Z1STA3_GIAMU|nr:Ankyrin repeat protein 1 [Giardia muris]|eukprot:TNJ29162.1 Ankyrin repeat protein 1 [Giardia muris]
MNSAWFEAVRKQDHAYISRNIHTNHGVRDEQGKTALMLSAEQGYIELVRILMGYEQKLTTNTGETALILAARAGQDAACKLLVGLEKGLKLVDGRDSLMVAAQSGHPAVVRTLIKYFRLAEDKNNMTAADYACESGQLECLRIIVEHFQLSRDDLSFLQSTADGRGYHEISRFLSGRKSCKAPTNAQTNLSTLSEDERQLFNELSGFSDAFSSQDDEGIKLAPPRRVRALKRVSVRLAHALEKGSDAPTEVDALKKQCTDLEMSLASEQAKVRARDLELMNMKLKLDAATAITPSKPEPDPSTEQECKTLRATVHNLTKQLQELKKAASPQRDDFSFKIASAELQLLRKEVEEKDKELADFRNKEEANKASKAAEIMSTVDNAYLERLEDELVQTRSDACDLREALQKVTTERDSLKSQLATSKVEMLRIATKSRASLSDDPKNNERIETLQKTVEERDNEINVHKTTIDDLQRALQALREASSAHPPLSHDEYERMKVMCTEQRKELENIHGVLLAKDEEIDELNAKLASVYAMPKDDAKELFEENVRLRESLEMMALSPVISSPEGHKDKVIGEEITRLKEALEQLAMSPIQDGRLTSKDGDQLKEENRQLQERVEQLELTAQTFQAQVAAKEAQYNDLTTSLTVIEQIEEKKRQTRKAETASLREKVAQLEQENAKLRGTNTVEEGSIPEVVHRDLVRLKMLVEEMALDTLSTDTPDAERYKAQIRDRDRRIRHLADALKNQAESFRMLRLAMQETGKENRCVLQALETNGETLRKVISMGVRSGFMTPVSQAGSPIVRSRANTPPKGVTTEQVIPALNRLLDETEKKEKQESQPQPQELHLSPQTQAALEQSASLAVVVLQNEIKSLREALEARDDELAILRKKINT